MTHRIGLVQMNSVEDFDTNLAFARKMIQQASEEKLSLVAFPEMFLYVGENQEEKNRIAQCLETFTLPLFQEEASRHHISILMGSVNEPSPDDATARFYNSSFLIDATGNVKAVYRKIHLCDIDSPNLKNIESRNIKPGCQAVVVPHEIGNIGLAICYDLRFPGLFQHLRLQGADIIFLPSAFFLQTGKDHWFPLIFIPIQHFFRIAFKVLKMLRQNGMNNIPVY
ncbi:MAG: carbon-nitrogen hydrolase family protein [SAR324 cluster bacterium]|nr:carbon-nitrogen hydrolase family protein [SAR324 cluster bacterium]